MSEWLLFNPNSAVFQLYHGKNKSRPFVQYSDFVSEWSDISTHGQLFRWASTIKIQLSGPYLIKKITCSCHVFWSRVNQSLLLLLNAEYLAEKQQIPILLSLVSPDWDSNSRSTEHETSTLTITPPMQSMVNINRESLQCRNLQNVKKSV
jgi:hypothetical protein